MLKVIFLNLTFGLFSDSGPRSCKSYILNFVLFFRTTCDVSRRRPTTSSVATTSSTSSQTSRTSGKTTSLHFYYLSVNTNLFLCRSFSLLLSFCLSHSLILSLYHSLTLSLSHYLIISISQFLTLSLYYSFTLSLSLSLCLSDFQFWVCRGKAKDLLTFFLKKHLYLKTDSF